MTTMNHWPGFGFGFKWGNVNQQNTYQANADIAAAKPANDFLASLAPELAFTSSLLQLATSSMQEQAGVPQGAQLQAQPSIGVSDFGLATVDKSPVDEYKNPAVDAMKAIEILTANDDAGLKKLDLAGEEKEKGKNGYDNKITTDNLKAALRKDSGFSSKEKWAVQYLLKNGDWDQISWGKDSATFDDFKTYYADLAANNSDGKIGDFKQGTGDCWFLSGVNAIAQDKDGRKIIRDAITDNGDGTYTVKFPGAPDKEYTVTEMQIDYNSNSHGDRDMEILEEAARQHFGDINGGRSAKAMALFTGQKAKEITTKEELKQIWKNDKDGITMTLGDDFYDGDPGAVVGKPGDTKPGGHAWTVTDIDFDTNTVTYVNPQHPWEKETMTIDQLLETDKITYMEVRSPDR